LRIGGRSLAGTGGPIRDVTQDMQGVPAAWLAADAESAVLVAEAKPSVEVRDEVPDPPEPEHRAMVTR
jgi:hypothetical protein